MMHTNHKITAFIIMLLSFCVCWYFKINITKESASGMLTAFAIITGFYITSITVITGSTSVTRLYNTPDPIIPTQTMLQTYRAYFLTSFYWSILSIILIILFLSTPFVAIDINSSPSIQLIPETTTLFNSLVASISMVNIYWSVVIFQTIMVIMLYEGKNKV